MALFCRNKASVFFNKTEVLVAYYLDLKFFCRVKVSITKHYIFDHTVFPSCIRNNFNRFFNNNGKCVL